jgi:hypothetical protein
METITNTALAVTLAILVANNVGAVQSITGPGT